jgi:hypothetical protein
LLQITNKKTIIYDDVETENYVTKVKNDLINEIKLLDDHYDIIFNPNVRLINVQKKKIFLW